MIQTAEVGSILQYARYSKNLHRAHAIMQIKCCIYSIDLDVDKYSELFACCVIFACFKQLF